MSVSTGMLRQLLVNDAREQPLRAPGKTALVIGNPIVSDTRFPSLEQARVEGETVADVLSAQGYDVTSLFETEAHPLAVLIDEHCVSEISLRVVFFLRPGRCWLLRAWPPRSTSNST